MKKSVKLVILLIVFALKMYAQEKIIFKVAYQPERTYTQTLEKTFENELTYAGSDEFLKRLKTDAVQNPTITKKVSTTKNVNKTGKLTEGKSFPLTVEFKDALGSHDENLIPDGTIIYGSVPEGKSPVFDSVHSRDMDLEFKKKFLLTMQITASQIALPKKKMKTGDSFKRKIPLTIPFGNMEFNMTNTVVYILKSISNNKAFFDISQVYTLNSSGTEHKVKVSGSGRGQVIYDIANTFYLEYQLESNIVAEVEKENYSVVVRTKSNYVQSTVLTLN